MNTSRVVKFGVENDNFVMITFPPADSYYAMFLPTFLPTFINYRVIIIGTA